jgi:hypothetical protein
MTAPEHPAFPRPPNLDVKIWRYLDFTKFVSMLENSGLYFCRADLLGDRFEGSFPQRTLARRPGPWKEMADEITKRGDAVTPEQLIEELALQFRKMPRMTYVNCWHQNEKESAAMWKLYSETAESIAIVSTYRKLVSHLDQKCLVGSITYKDYETDVVDDWNAFSGLMHKRISFEHEREVRALFWYQFDREKMAGLKEDEEITVDLKDLPPGVWEKVLLNEFIDKICVSPESASWFEGLVSAVSKRYGLTVAVSRSSLEGDPVF